MRRFVILLALLLVAGSASAAWLGRTPPAKPSAGGTYQGGGRTGGDTVADAVLIPSIPFTDTGSTCGFANDYDAVCPTGSTSPDVVYSWFAPVDLVVQVDLCTSQYDTKVYVWEDVEGNVIACNDDYAGCGYSGWQARIWSVAFVTGHTYYIVVDGYGDACGDYALSVSSVPLCVVECPPGAQQEGEPPCHDGYIDQYNAGCGVGFTPLAEQAGGCGTMCGRSCTFDQALSYRDTDWYTCTTTGGMVTATCTAEFPLQLVLIYGANCLNLQYVMDTGDPCEPVSLDWDFAGGMDFWVWVGASVFTGVPESDYTLEVCGITANSPNGACCNQLGYCFEITQQLCEQNGYGTWLGPDADCDPYPCGSNPPGACCLPAGACQALSSEECSQSQGVWLGAGTDCEPDPCGAVPVQQATWGAIKHLYR